MFGSLGEVVPPFRPTSHKRGRTTTFRRRAVGAANLNLATVVPVASRLQKKGWFIQVILYYTFCYVIKMLLLMLYKML